MTKTIGTGDVTDFDETRRLLYMALVAGRTKKYNLAGTIINALVHHHAVEGLSAGEVTDHVVNVLEGVDVENIASSRRWVQAQIDRITAEMGG